MDYRWSRIAMGTGCTTEQLLCISQAHQAKHRWAPVFLGCVYVGTGTEVVRTLALQDILNASIQHEIFVCFYEMWCIKARLCAAAFF